MLRWSDLPGAAEQLQLKCLPRHAWGMFTFEELWPRELIINTSLALQPRNTERRAAGDYLPRLASIHRADVMPRLVFTIRV